MITFAKSFMPPDPILREGIQQAVEVMGQGTLYRYNFSHDLVPCRDAEATGSQNDQLGAEVAMLEYEFGRYLDREYVIAVNSCGSAIFLALKALGVGYADKVLANAFTFTAVPSAVIHAGAVPVYVECTSEYVIDLDDLQHNLEQHPDAKCFLLSYMRGHVPDLAAIGSICERAGIPVIEDCAHSLGATWDGRPVGNHGQISCFSTQSYKALNSGEGGLIATSDENIAVYCILAAGSYEKLYTKHLARPFDDNLFEKMKAHIPNFSLRMSNLTAAVLRPQLKSLDAKVHQGRERYERLARILGSARNIYIPSPSTRLQRAPDSMQFTVSGLTVRQLDTFVQRTGARGVEIQIFGRPGSSRYYKNWRYSFTEQPSLDKTDGVITSTCDIRLPASFDRDDIDVIGYIIKDVLYQLLSGQSSQDYPDGLTDRFAGIDEVERTYDDWVPAYDRQHHVNGWMVLLNHLAYTLLPHLRDGDLVLDLGCGTGLLGRELNSYGVRNLHGLDVSRRSLETLEDLSTYQVLHLETLGGRLSFADGSFDALVSAGVFTRNQVPMEAFDELIRVLRPGGIFAVALRVEDDGWYERPIRALCAQGVWQELSREQISVLRSCGHELMILRKSSAP